MTIGQRAIVQLILLMGQEVVVDLMVVIMSIQMDLTMFPRRISIEPLCYGVNGETVNNPQCLKSISMAIRRTDILGDN